MSLNSKRAIAVDTEFTSRLAVLLMSDVANLMKTAERLALQVEVLAKEHGVPVAAFADDVV